MDGQQWGCETAQQGRFQGARRVDVGRRLGHEPRVEVSATNVYVASSPGSLKHVGEPGNISPCE